MLACRKLKLADVKLVTEHLVLVYLHSSELLLLRLRLLSVSIACLLHAAPLNSFLWSGWSTRLPVPVSSPWTFIHQPAVRVSSVCFFQGVSESSTAGLKVLQKTWNGPERRHGVSQRLSTFPTCVQLLNKLGNPRSRPKAHKHSGIPPSRLITERLTSVPLNWIDCGRIILSRKVARTSH